MFVIGYYRFQAFNQQLTSQYKAHLDNLFSILESYLKSKQNIRYDVYSK